MDVPGDIATGALALFAAFALLVSVRAMHDARAASNAQIVTTQKLGVTAVEQLAASMVPILVDARQDSLDDGRATELFRAPKVRETSAGQIITIPCRNVGPGAAVIEAAAVAPIEHEAVTRTDGADFRGGLPAEVSLGVVPSGESAILTVSIGPLEPAEAVLARVLGFAFCAMVRYTDVAGEQRRLSVIYVIPDPSGNGRYREVGVRVHRCDDKWNLATQVFAGRRVEQLPTGSQRFANIVSSVMRGMEEASKEYSDAADKALSILDAQDKRLEEAVGRIDPRIIRLGRQMREADEAAADGAKVETSGRSRT